MNISRPQPLKKMKVDVKDLNISSMQIKEKGIELAVYNDKEFLGDLVIRNTGIIWCKGKTTPQNGEFLNWEKFIKFMQSPAKNNLLKTI